MVDNIRNNVDEARGDGRDKDKLDEEKGEVEIL